MFVVVNPLDEVFFLFLWLFLRLLLRGLLGEELWVESQVQGKPGLGQPCCHWRHGILLKSFNRALILVIMEKRLHFSASCWLLDNGVVMMGAGLWYDDAASLASGQRGTRSTGLVVRGVSLDRLPSAHAQCQGQWKATWRQPWPHQSVSFYHTQEYYKPWHEMIILQIHEII